MISNTSWYVWKILPSLPSFQNWMVLKYLSSSSKLPLMELLPSSCSMCFLVIWMLFSPLAQLLLKSQISHGNSILACSAEFGMFVSSDFSAKASCSVSFELLTFAAGWTSSDFLLLTFKLVDEVSSAIRAAWPRLSIACRLFTVFTDFGREESR